MILFVFVKLNEIHDQGRKFNWIKLHSCPRCGSDRLWGTASLWLILMALTKVCFCVASDVRIVAVLSAYPPSGRFHQPDICRHGQHPCRFSASENNGVLDPVVLDAMAHIGNALQERHPQIGKTLSVVDLIRKMNQAFFFNDPSFYRLPVVADLAGERTEAALKAHLASYLDKYQRSDKRPFYSSLVAGPSIRSRFKPHKAQGVNHAKRNRHARDDPAGLLFAGCRAAPCRSVRQANHR